MTNSFFLHIIIGVRYNTPIFCWRKRELQILKCLKCGQPMLKIYTKGDVFVDFSLENATETAKCRNCGAKISYSVRKKDKEIDNGRN